MYYLMSLRMYFQLHLLGHGFNSSSQEDQKFKSSLGCLMMEFEAKPVLRETSLRKGGSPNVTDFFTV